MRRACGCGSNGGAELAGVCSSGLVLGDRIVWRARFYSAPVVGHSTNYRVALVAAEECSVESVKRFATLCGRE